VHPGRGEVKESSGEWREEGRRRTWKLFNRSYGSNGPSPLITPTKDNTKESTKDKYVYTKDMFTR
jgi:hypothetical protein